MEQNEFLDERVRQTLSSLDGIKRASPGPFFYTRMMARLDAEEKNLWERVTAFLAKPVVVVSFICLVLVLNLTAVFKQSEPSLTMTDQVEVSLADQYKISSTSFYDYENEEP
jgi:hypothetical protein